MGDPKFPRPKWARPSRPWQADRIKGENELIGEFGLKNKREVWKAESQLRRWRQRARDLQAQIRYENPQAEKEVGELLGRLAHLGILPRKGATLDDVLSLETEDLLQRRLQTVVYLRGLAHTVRQARQFIVHGHVAVGGRRVTIPGYLVRVDEEEEVRYHPRSELAHEAHPARPSPETVQARQQREEAAG